MEHSFGSYSLFRMLQLSKSLIKCVNQKLHHLTQRALLSSALNSRVMCLAPCITIPTNSAYSLCSICKVKMQRLRRVISELRRLSFLKDGRVFPAEFTDVKRGQECPYVKILTLLSPRSQSFSLQRFLHHSANIGGKSQDRKSCGKASQQ